MTNFTRSLDEHNSVTVACNSQLLLIHIVTVILLSLYIFHAQRLWQATLNLTILIVDL